MTTRIQLRRDTAANWTANNPTLAEGELGFELDTGLLKVGKANTPWTSLAYAQLGPKGDTGDIGPTGATGGMGANGVDGLPGSNGIDGLNGLDGINGIDGAPGMPGEPGPPGADGAEGLSAYEVWLGLGNSGTEQEFIDSLQGSILPETKDISADLTTITITTEDIGKYIYSYAGDPVAVSINVDPSTVPYGSQITVIQRLNGPVTIFPTSNSGAIYFAETDGITTGTVTLKGIYSAATIVNAEGFWVVIGSFASAAPMGGGGGG